MIADTVLYGKVNLPDDKESIIKEIEICREQYIKHPSRLIQTMIDYLEYALDEVTRDEV